VTPVARRGSGQAFRKTFLQMLPKSVPESRAPSTPEHHGAGVTRGLGGALTAHAGGGPAPSRRRRPASRISGPSGTGQAATIYRRLRRPGRSARLTGRTTAARNGARPWASSIPGPETPPPEAGTLEPLFGDLHDVKGGAFGDATVRVQARQHRRRPRTTANSASGWTSRCTPNNLGAFRPWHEPPDAAPFVPTVDDWAAHAKRVVRTVGPDHIAIGLDLEAAGAVFPVGASGYLDLLTALARSLSPETAAQVAGQNWLRVFDAVLAS
jgi:hypothetical protein